MIISASRRTDIPTYYSDWFFNRLKEQYVLVRNPNSIHQVSRIDLNPDLVDGIVFWTKNPIPMMGRLSELNPYNYYFQFALNAYSTDVEPNIPSKNDVLIPAFKDLSRKIGKDRVIWRYDPIFLNDKYTMEYHCTYFKKLVQFLGDYTEKCTVSFIDLYNKTIRNTRTLNIKEPTLEQKLELLYKFSITAEKAGIYIDTCSENLDTRGLNIPHASCIDCKRFEKLGTLALAIDKDPYQRKECGCVASIDIGAYNSCLNGCLYCYANFNKTLVEKSFAKHNPLSPLIFGELQPEDNITPRRVKSYKVRQQTLFDGLNINFTPK